MGDRTITNSLIYRRKSQKETNGILLCDFPYFGIWSEGGWEDGGSVTRIQSVGSSDCDSWSVSRSGPGTQSDSGSVGRSVGRSLGRLVTCSVGRPVSRGQSVETKSIEEFWGVEGDPVVFFPNFYIFLIFHEKIGPPQHVSVKGLSVGAPVLNRTLSYYC